MDLFEVNEAFAAQSVAVVKELGLCQDKVSHADLTVPIFPSRLLSMVGVVVAGE